MQNWEYFWEKLELPSISGEPIKPTKPTKPIKHNDDDDAADDLLLILLILLLFCLFVPTTLCLWVSFSLPLRERVCSWKFAFPDPLGHRRRYCCCCCLFVFFV